MRKGFTRNFQPLKVLSDSQVETIHRNALDILERIGIIFDHKGALELLEKNDCIVDYEKKVVKIPGSLVEECVSNTPTSFLVKARESKDDLRIGGNTLHFFSSVGAKIIDPLTGDLRKPTMKENDEGVIISDALDTIHILASYCPYFEIQGVEPVMLCPTSLARRIMYSSKTSRGAQATDTYIFETQLAQAVGQQLLGVCEAADPLSWPYDGVNAAFEYIKAGFPMYIGGGPVLGATAPSTIAGAVVHYNANVLGMVVLVQCIKKGTGITVNNFVNPMDMENGAPLFCSLGVNLHQMAFNQIWSQLYEIPVCNTGSGFVNSKMIDFQSGYEKTHTAVFSAVSGANLLIYHGGLTAELSYSPLVAIINDDIANIIGRTIEGIEVNDTTLASSVIEQVGQIPGTFLNKRHTFENWRKDYFMPKVSDRLSYPEWYEKGKKTIIDNARDRMEEILANHKVSPITSEQEKDINNILKEARNYYKKKGLIK